MTKSIFTTVSAGAAIAGAGIWLAGATAVAHADTAPDGSSTSPASHVSSSSPKKRVSVARAAAVPAEVSGGSAVPVAAEPPGRRTTKARATVSSGPVHSPGVRTLSVAVAAAPRITPAAAAGAGHTATKATAPADATPVVATAASTTATVTAAATVKPTVTTAASVSTASTGNPVVDLLAGVLSFFGLNSPQAPADPIGALAWEVFRRVETAFGVVPASAQSTASAPAADGVVTGSVAIDQSAALPVTYTATADPAQGVVSLNADGTFTYTPTQAARLAAGEPGATGTATFTVTASNGLAATSTPVTVQVAPYEKGAVIATVPVGLYPIGLALSNDGRHLYVIRTRLDGGDGSVVVVDTTTNTVVGGPVTVGGVGGQTPDAAVTPDGSHVYVVNVGDNTVSVIDTATDTIVATVAVGSEPIGVAITPDGKYAYVTNSDGGNGDGTVSVIDTATNTVVGNPILVRSQPQGVVVTPNGRYVYVANTNDTVIVGGRRVGTVSVIDVATNTVVGQPIPVTSGPIGLVVSPDGKFVYVNDIDGALSTIDTATNTTVGTPVNYGGIGLAHLAVSGDGKYVYVLYQGNLMTIDTATHTVVDTVATSVGANDLALSPDGSVAYVVDALGGVNEIYTGNWVTAEPADA